MSQDLIFSLDHALTLVDDDRELLRAMIERFVEHGPQDLIAIQAAVAAQDAAALAGSAPPSERRPRAVWCACRSGSGQQARNCGQDRYSCNGGERLCQTGSRTASVTCRDATPP